MSGFLYTYSPWTIAAAYGQGDYGACQYSSSSANCITSSGSNGSLINTGSAALVVTIVAVVILLAALAVKLNRQKSNK